MAKKSEGWLRRKMYADGETWLFCYYTTRPEDNKRVEHSQRVGLVKDFPTQVKVLVEVDKRGYGKLLDNLVPINPTFSEIAEHWRTFDLKRKGSIGRRAAETIEVTESNLDLYVIPRWGTTKALEIQPTEVEAWFEWLNSTPQGRRKKPLQWKTVQKIKSVMSMVFSHALRNKLLPVSLESTPFRGAAAGGARCKQSSSYEATVVSPVQMIAILETLDEPATQLEWMLALLHACTALRPEEAFGLRWNDVQWDKGQILIQRGFSKGKVTPGKNEQSMVPIPMHPALAAYLQTWREQSLYPKDTDWMFPSLKLKGKKPRTASRVSQNYLRPAAVKAGVIEEGSSKRFGFHNLRHSLATFLSGMVDPSVTRLMLRHKKLSTTMEVYSHRVNSTQQDAQGLYLQAIRKLKPASEAVQ
jgi:site-specific recombinase XerD